MPRAREETVYDRIGRTYTLTRTPDTRIARLIEGALADSISVVNVGAGTGAYEPRDRRVVAIEPSETMVRQRPTGAAPAVIASAESLPLCNDSVDAAFAILTVHHWADPIRGLSELRRVARDRVVIFTCDPTCGVEFWLWEYLPALGAVDRARQPPLSLYQAALGELEVIPVPVPHDCTDGFLAAYWRRPEAYLSEVRKSEHLHLQAASRKRDRTRARPACKRHRLGCLGHKVRALARAGGTRCRVPAPRRQLRDAVRRIGPEPYRGTAERVFLCRTSNKGRHPARRIGVSSLPCLAASASPG